MGKEVGSVGAATGAGSDYSECGVVGPGGEQGLYDYTEYYDESWDYDGSGNSSSNSSYGSGSYTRVSSSSDHYTYVGWDDYSLDISDSGSFKDEWDWDFLGYGWLSSDGDTGYFTENEARAGSYTYDSYGSASDVQTSGGGTYVVSGGSTYVVPGTTILLAETVASGIHWAEPRDLTFAKMTFRVNDREDPAIGSCHAGGAHVLLADGTVQFLPNRTDPEMVKGMATVAGGEARDQD